MSDKIDQLIEKIPAPIMRGFRWSYPIAMVATCIAILLYSHANAMRPSPALLIFSFSFFLGTTAALTTPATMQSDQMQGNVFRAAIICKLAFNLDLHLAQQLCPDHAGCHDMFSLT